MELIAQKLVHPILMLILVLFLEIFLSHVFIAIHLFLNNLIMKMEYVDAWIDMLIMLALVNLVLIHYVQLVLIIQPQLNAQHVLLMRKRLQYVRVWLDIMQIVVLV